MAEYVGPPNPMKALPQLRDGHASEEDDDEEKRSGGGGGSKGKGPPSASSAGSSGRKPRGRPPGSKNKPKPPIVITRESESAMHPVILELSAGCDVLESVSTFARRRRIGISLLSGSGSVANVVLRHPTSHSATITLSGRFDILSLAGTFLPPSNSTAITSSKSPFTISLAGSQGQVIGGTVAGALTAAGPVVLVAASFLNPEFYRLPAVEEEGEGEGEGKEEDVKPGVGTVGGYSLTGPTNPLTGQLANEMVLWGTPSSSRAATHHTHSHPPPHY